MSDDLEAAWAERDGAYMSLDEAREERDFLAELVATQCELIAKLQEQATTQNEELARFGQLDEWAANMTDAVGDMLVEFGHARRPASYMLLPWPSVRYVAELAYECG